MYARGAEHEYREPCRTVVRLAGQGVLAGAASVELVQEYAHILRRRGLGGADVREQARDVAALSPARDIRHPLRRPRLRWHLWAGAARSA
ncbi:MAG: hypothetical protein ACRDSF_22930 [Pseudonocardiaceae bacterium]